MNRVERKEEINYYQVLKKAKKHLQIPRTESRIPLQLKEINKTGLESVWGKKLEKNKLY